MSTEYSPKHNLSPQPQVAMTPKVSICMKLGIAALIFGSSFSFFRSCEPISSQSSCNDHPLDGSQSRTRCPPAAPCDDDIPGYHDNIDLDLKKMIYKSAGIELYMSDAYLDDRNNETYLRLFGLQQKDKIKVEFNCKYSTNSKGVEVGTEVRAKRILVDKTWPDYSPHFAVNFDCKLPLGDSPTVVTLASVDGKHSFRMPVNHIRIRPNRKTLAVCVKPITGHFRVSRIVEWVEMVRASGVDKIILYDSELTGSAKYVLDYYQKIGVATIVTWPYLMAVLQSVDNANVSSSQRYAVYQQTYLVAMHDCLYRFRGMYENMLFVDLDEVLLPTRHGTLVEMIREIRAKYKHGAGFLFNTAWHFEEHGEIRDVAIPGYLYMQRFARATLPGQVQPKSIVSTDRAISVNFHTILDVPRKDYSNEVMAADYAYLHHYRGRCDQKFEPWRCKEFLAKPRVDPVMTRYRREMTTRVGRVLNYINMN